MAIETDTWRDHYLELLKEGEAAGFTFQALGYYIAQRMTPAELRSGLREFYAAQDRAKRLGGTPHAEP